MMGLIEVSRMAFRRVGGLAAGLMAAGLLGACALGGAGPDSVTTTGIAPGTQPAATSPLAKRSSVKVALLLPLSAKGRAASIAKGLKQAGELALFEFDKPNVLLFSKDTHGTPEGARAAAEDAVRNGAELIIGPLYARSVPAVRDVARSAGLPVMAFSSDRSVAGNGVYLLSFLAGADIPRVVSYSLARGKRRFAALIPKTRYGDVVEQNFRSTVSRLGGEVLGVQRFPLDANGMMAPTRKIKAIASNAAKSGRPLDAVFLPAGQEALPTLSTLLPYFEIDTKSIQLIGSGAWDYASVGQEKPLLGGWYPAPDPKGWREFARRYSETYGGIPPRIASLAYDAVSLAVSLSTNPPGQRYTVANLTRPSGFAGVDGLFRLRPDGTTERGLAVLEVQKFGARVLDPAPSVFGRPRYSSLTRTPLN